MGRPHIEFIQGFDQPEERIREGELAGGYRRLLSADDETGAWTALVRLPAGWSGDLDGYARPVELLGLSGELELAGQTLGPAHYAYVPSGGGDKRAAASGEMFVLAMVEDERDTSAEGPVHVLDTRTMQYEPIGPEQGVPSGIVIKKVRVDPERGDWTYMVACAPRWYDTKAEHHPTIQEGFMIRGDLLNGRFGSMRSGTYFWRPPMVPHGPMFTRGGAEFIFRTKGGSWEVHYEEIPEWMDIVAEYQNREPYFTPLS